jgi:type VI protein secretion system component VasK
VASTRRTPPPPLEGNDRLITAVITAAWVVALVVVLIARDSLPAGERWWVWTCVTGVVLGFFGLWYVPHLQRRRAKMATGRAAQAQQDRLQQGTIEQARTQPGTQDSPVNDSNTVSSNETPGRSTRS